MTEQIKGAVLFAVLCLVCWLGWHGVQEYRYYQVVKREHQAFFLDEFGRTADGRPFTRKQLFDSLVVESIKRGAQARKEP